MNKKRMEQWSLTLTTENVNFSDFNKIYWILFFTKWIDNSLTSTVPIKNLFEAVNEPLVSNLWNAF